MWLLTTRLLVQVQPKDSMKEILLISHAAEVQNLYLTDAEFLRTLYLADVNVRFLAVGDVLVDLWGLPPYNPLNENITAVSPDLLHFDCECCAIGEGHKAAHSNWHWNLVGVICTLVFVTACWWGS